MRDPEQASGGRPEKAAWGRYSGGAGIPALAARPQLRAPEQSSGGGHQGAPKKRPGAAIRGGRDTGPRCQTAIEGPGAVLRRGPPRRPEKAAWGRYSGGAGIPALAARPQLRAPEQASGGGHQGAPKKRPGAAIRGAGIPAHAARPQLRATEQGAGGGHQGDPKKRPGAAIRGGRDTGPSALPDRNCGPRAACR